MKQEKALAWKRVELWAVAAAMAFGSFCSAQAPHARKTRNVILVMIDGMRWQEVFRGADAALLPTLGPKWLNHPEQMTAAAEARYGGASADQRRQALMPFLWSVVAAQGQIFGNRDLGSDSHVINGIDVSYPGYSETLTGFADPRIDSNKNIPNPNQTVFEWLNAKPEFAGRVAAFGAWATFNEIFNRDRCNCVVNAGYDAFTAIPSTPELTLLNTLRTETPQVWADEPFDPIPFRTALAYMKAKHPRVLFIGLGETDEWAHEGAYAAYLDATHRSDEYLREVWELAQTLPEYKGKTTLIVVPDHGRGEGAGWLHHGIKYPESQQTWMAFLGPDTPGLGERKGGPAVTESEIAATLAAFLGQDYHGAMPKSGGPIEDVLSR